jgi:hypothetical protein
MILSLLIEKKYFTQKNKCFSLGKVFLILSFSKFSGNKLSTLLVDNFVGKLGRSESST